MPVKSESGGNNREYYQAELVFVDPWINATDIEPPETWYTPLIEVN